MYYTFIDLKHPLRSAIILYLITLSFIIVFRPKLIKNKQNRYVLPLTILLVSIVSYYVFALLYELV